MAKYAQTVGFSNAVITYEDGRWYITEYSKDDCKEYVLDAVLSKFVGIEGISLSIKQSTDIAQTNEEGATEVD